MTQLTKAIVFDQYRQIWESHVATDGSEKKYPREHTNIKEEPLLSKVWRLSKERDTAMIAAGSTFKGAPLDDRLCKRKSNKLERELMGMGGYRFAKVKGRDTLGLAQDFYYVWDEHGRAEFKENMLTLARRFEQDYLMFQKLGEDYQQISLVDGTTVSFGCDGFGVLNGHFYKVIEGRPFVLESISYGYFEPETPTSMRGVIHFARMDLDEYMSMEIHNE